MREIKIGRNPDNDIIIHDETRTVSGYHAILKVYDNGTVTICDSSTNCTTINGVKATKNTDVPVRKGDEIRFSRFEALDWSIVAIPVAAPIDATIMATDVKETYTLGTENDNRIIISDPSRLISRHHAILKHKADGKFYICDQSTNGTYVNGVRIKSNVDFPVSSTDTISLANSYQLDWTKIPNAPLQKPVPPSSSHPNPIHSGSSVKREKNNSNTIPWVVAIAVILIVFYFKFYVDDSKETPIVETIKTEVTQPIQTTPIATEPDISALYEMNKAAVFMVFTSNGTNNYQGSGFFISSSGVAVSNYHVFKETYKSLATIKTMYGQYQIDTVYAKSEESDYIIFKIESQGSSFPYLRIASYLPKVGENVFAIGNPKGLEHTLSTGIISALRGNNSIIQTSAEITNGSSGGPLFNMRGEVIGITSAGVGEANLNFAVSIVGLGFGNY